MSKYHAVSSGMVTRQALPSITRQRGTTTGSANLMLYGAGKTYAIGTNTTFTDSSANAFTVTRNGDTIQATANPFTGSVVFDGTGDYLSLANNAAFDFGTGNFTVECWVNINSVSYVNGGGGRGASVFSAVSGFSGNGWNLEIGGNSSGVPSTVNFNSRQGSSQVTVSANVTMANGTWYHIAVVRSGTLTSIYLNGVSVGSGTLSNQTITSVAALWVGGQDITNYQHWCNGYISNARVVKGTAVYTANFTPPTSPLTAITNTSLLLLAGQQAPFRDSSSNAFTVTANGNAAGSGVEPPSFVPYAGSGYFDGTGDYLSLPTNAAFDFGTGDFTVEAWVYIAGNSPLDGLNRRIACVAFTGTVASTQMLFVIMGDASSTGTGILFSNGPTSLNITTSISQSAWHHVAATRSGTTLRLFVDGVQVGSDTAYSGAVGSTANATWVGRTSQTGYTYDFNGYISNARVVKGTAVYTANFTPSAAPLTAITNTSLLLLTNNVGPFIDSSANGFPVLRIGDTVQSGFNPFNQASAGAGYFEGTTDYLTCADNAAFAFGTGNFTVEYWIYPTALPGFAIVDTRTGGGSTTGYSDYITSAGKFGLYINATTIFLSTASIPTNAWTHVAVTRSGTSLRVFFNGVQQDSTVTNSTAMNDTKLLIGAGVGPTPGTLQTVFLTGYLTNVRLVKGTAVYTSNFTPPTSPLTAITNTSLLLLTDNYSIVNSTSTNLPVTINGNTTISTAQFPTGMSSSIYFDGNGDYLSIPDNANLNMGTSEFTLEAFIYLSSAPGITATVLNKDGKNTVSWPQYAIYVNSSYKVNLSLSSVPNIGIGPTVLITGATTLSLNTWYHVAATRSGTSTTLWVNGVSDGTSSSVPATLNNGARPLLIGWEDRNAPDTAYNFPGYISNLRICKGTALYTANFTPPSLPMSTTVTVPAFVTNNIYGVNQIP